MGLNLKHTLNAPLTQSKHTLTLTTYPEPYSTHDPRVSALPLHSSLPPHKPLNPQLQIDCPHIPNLHVMSIPACETLNPSLELLHVHRGNPWCA